jgi:hypothetical protein
MHIQRTVFNDGTDAALALPDTKSTQTGGNMH